MSSASVSTVFGPTRAQRARMLVVGVLPSLVMAAASSTLLLSWRSQLPNPVASHWGSGGVNGTMSVTTLMVVVAAVGLAAAIAGLVVALRVSRPELARTAIPVANGVVALFAALAPATTAGQRGLDATEVMHTAVPVVGIVVTLVVALAVGVLSMVALPRWDTADAPVAGQMPRTRIGAGEQFLWRGRAASSPVLAVIIGIAVAVVIGAAILTSSWWLLLVPLVLLVILVVMWSVTVSVDRRGVTIRGMLGHPRVNISMSEISRAEVVEVSALGDFGGYGYRLAIRGTLKGAQGFVLRSGPALLVTRTDGRRDIVVVDGAAAAAGLINGVLNPAG